MGSIKRMDAYSTHIEALVNAALYTEGDILELGCGDYSTPVLSSIAKRLGVKLFVKSSSPDWANKYTSLADVEIVDWETWKPVGKYGLVFLDNEQYTSERIKLLPMLAKVSKVIVMHDADAAMTAPDYEDLTSHFKFSTLYSIHKPYTVTYIC